MVWTRKRILQELRKLHRGGADLSYNGLARTRQPVLSAAAYHFGSYRAALAHAGIDYAEHRRRPRWTKKLIIAQIKRARRSGHDLHWSAVTTRGDELSRAAFAAVQPRLFGSWARALHAAGLDADDVNLYHTWDRNSVTFELRARRRDGEPLNSAAVQKEEPALHAAAVRHFGNFSRALLAAHVDPKQVRRRRQWTQAEVIRGLKQARRRGQHLSDSSLRSLQPALHGAAVRLFGSLPAARKAAGLAFASRRTQRRR